MLPPDFDKYAYYMASVQSPDTDVEFFTRVFDEIRGRTAQSFREDFCGTFALTQEWVKQTPGSVGYAIDLDPEPLAYGQNQMLKNLTREQQSRVHYFNHDVLDIRSASADLVVALNFSYFIFKEREQLRRYFANVFEKLTRDGVMIIDCFGGSQCYEPIEEETDHDDFIYYWDQKSFDPVSNGAQFSIHFKIKGGKKIEDVFTYDWRMWSLPELREILAEAGFKKTTVYWEGTTEDGEGDGDFQPTEKGEDCESWIAYIAAEK